MSVLFGYNRRMHPNTISRQTARRFVLGRQGLWPGRRFAGKDGTEAALRQMQDVQVDPINVIGRSHDLALFSRVLDYRPRDLEALLYTDRKFLDYGNILLIHPMDELPFWQPIMQRQRERHAERAAHHREAEEHVIAEMKARGPLACRDFGGRTRIRGGFNTMKDTSAALYILWIGGHVMTHSRRGFDRVHDFFENVAGTPFAPTDVSIEEAEGYFAVKTLRDLGLATVREWAKRASVIVHRRIGLPEAQSVLDSLRASGQAAGVEVEGQKQPYFLPCEGAALIPILETGGVPENWKPLETTTEDEVTFLAPLDNVVWDRDRAKSLFEFEYLWEVYKPAHLRRWGYYTLPILYGDRLVGRIQPVLDRKAGVLRVSGLWLDDPGLESEPAFAAALAAGLARFARYHGVVVENGVGPKSLC